MRKRFETSSHWLEETYSSAESQFEDREGSILIFQMPLYDHRSSIRAFRAHFADFLKSSDIPETRHDHHVWMRAQEKCDGYDYVCAHIDDFKVVTVECRIAISYHNSWKVIAAQIANTHWCRFTTSRTFV